MMRFSFALILSGWLALTFSARGELPNRPRFAQETSDLRPDARVRYGQLPNGLHYAILANHEPRQRASFRLLVLAGSAQETDEQRGLAHFVEHMAFNGSTHYPPGTLVELFQRLGMNWGGDTNANTTFSRTVYLLELPNTEAKTITEGCRVFTDYARGELLQATEIDKERGIILSEKRDRDSVEYRRDVAVEEFLLSKTLMPKREPIGTAEVITQAGADRLRAYYDTWYRPERMAIVAVGDFDPAAVETEIKSHFASLAVTTPEPPDPSLGEIPALSGDRVLYRHEAEGAETIVMSYSVVPYSYEPDTRAHRRKELPRDLAFAMLNRRFSILARRADAPFIQGGAGVEEVLDFYRLAGFQLTCKPEQWSSALTVGETELRRALEHGFDPAELAEAAANLRHDLEESVKADPTRRSQALADHLVDSLIDGYVFTSPEDELELFKPALEKITVNDCVAALREAFPSSTGHSIAVVGNAQIDAPKPETGKPVAGASAPRPEDQILAVYQAAAAAPVEPPPQVSDTAFAYADFGTAGKVTEKKHVEDLDIDLLTLSNGARLNLKKTDFEANRIYVHIRVGTGLLTAPQNKPGLGTLANETFVRGGLGKHTIDELIRMAAGRTVGLGFQVGSDAIVLSGVTNQEDLLFQLQLLTAYLVDAGYRPEALETGHKNFEPMYQRLEHTPDGPLQLHVTRDLASGDPRFGLVPKEQLFARTLEEVRDWLQPQFKNGAMEITVIGDLDSTAAIDAVEKTLGALPNRGPKPRLEAERRVQRPKEPFTREFTVETEIPHGLVCLFWPSTDAIDAHRERRARLLSDVFADRLRVEIREKLGDAYSPSAYHSADEIYTGYGWFVSMVEVDPDKTQMIMDAVLRIASDLAEKGVTEEELERAKKPVFTALRETLRTNSYWLHSVLQSAQELPRHLDWCRDREADNQAISKADLDALAREYLAPGGVFRVVIRPKKS